MIVSFKSLGLAAALALGFAIPVQAQTTAVPDISQVHAACLPDTASVPACHAAINSHHAALQGGGFSQDDIDSHLHSLAMSLGEASQTGGNSSVISSGIRHIATLMSDPVRSASVSQLGTAVGADSELPVTAIGTPIAASPN